MTGSIDEAGGVGFQEAAAHAPKLYSWGARALYIGPSLNLSPHRNAVAVLAIGLHGPFEVAEAPGAADSKWRTFHDLVIGSDQLHHLRATAGPIGFLYVDPLGADMVKLGCAATVQALGGAIRKLAHGQAEWRPVRAQIDALLGGEASVDPRVRTAVQAMIADPSLRPSLTQLAEEARLSPSRFRRLFRAGTGVTVRRYRIWVAMGAAMRSVAAGRNLTTAALDAGFSSSAHFSTAFREMFGLEPSRLAKGLHLERRPE